MGGGLVRVLGGENFGKEVLICRGFPVPMVVFDDDRGKELHMADQDKIHATNNAQRLQEAVLSIVPKDTFEGISFRKESVWQPWSLVSVALFWAWSGKGTLTGRFKEARAVVADCAPPNEQPGTSYEGFRKRLECWSPKLKGLLMAEFQQVMRYQLSAFFFDGGLACVGWRWQPTADATHGLQRAAFCRQEESESDEENSASEPQATASEPEKVTSPPQKTDAGRRPQKGRHAANVAERVVSLGLGHALGLASWTERFQRARACDGDGEKPAGKRHACHGCGLRGLRFLAKSQSGGRGLCVARGEQRATVEKSRLCAPPRGSCVCVARQSPTSIATAVGAAFGPISRRKRGCVCGDQRAGTEPPFGFSVARNLHASLGRGSLLPRFQTNL